MISPVLHILESASSMSPCTRSSIIAAEILPTAYIEALLIQYVTFSLMVEFIGPGTGRLLTESPVAFRTNSGV